MSFMNQQFGVIHPWSSFQRRNFSLSLLHLLSVTFSETPADSEVPAIFRFHTAVSKGQARSLVLALQDSFEANQKIALELLLQLPVNVIGLEVCTKNNLSELLPPSSATQPIKLKAVHNN